MTIGQGIQIQAQGIGAGRDSGGASDGGEAVAQVVVMVAMAAAIA